MTAKSRSIPIAPSRYHLLEQRYMQDEQAAIMQADYDDYLFYRRIVGGIEKTQEAVQCTKLRDQNQELINHLHYIRHASSALRTSSNVVGSPPSRISHSTSYTRRWNFLPSNDWDLYDHENDSDEDSTGITPCQSYNVASFADDETLIFELDL